ncbi:Vacuolar protein-sorting protein BRO1 [Debaryomyces fabryi]|uniref:BRO domain-containing protein 1 n=1 Tax=Debaryomyces fabryi TaxID=58627 RepID=A0A0V1Q261_9ASCO|nr:Vacuolar protein-sorting protein BRO1 [Debaryomyces fabryi]KSA02530.1 Vacuolar protein-sorting protein BRO1 [Debaryomyces fabryi]CUM47737.1 unnamed protein product [Debaryomyces fabryi]
MKTYLFSIPTKKSEETSWTKPLNNYLLSIYGNTTEYQQDLEKFDKLRQDIRGVSADNTGIKLYYNYYSQLELLDLRFPFSTVNRHKKLNFSWYDAFQPSVVHKQTALAFEKACVLFNLGALLSRYAGAKYEEAQRNSSSAAADDTIKESLQILQQTAGIYQFLNENFLHAPSNDLHQGSVKFLEKLMLAQAQEVFVLKVISGDLEQNKNSLIAKLCQGTTNHYTECFNMVSNTNKSAGIGRSQDEFAVIDTNENIDDILGEEEEEDDTTEKDGEPQVTANIDASWIAVIHFKVQFYEALSYYFNGLQLEKNSKYGDSIAYLTKSQNILNEISSNTLKAISKSGSNDSYELLDNYKYQKDAVGIKLTDMNKDNDFIYHDIIPSLITLPEIKPMDGVKTIPINNSKLFNDLNEYNYSNFFSNVVPINIHELLSFYSEEKSQFLRNELDLVDVSNEELASILEYLKMPKSLVNLKEIMNSSKQVDAMSASLGTNISPEVRNIVNEISSKYDADTSNKDHISAIRKEIYNTITESESSLSGKFSESLIKYKDDLVRLKKSLVDASNSDNNLFGLINNDNSHLYSILGKGADSPEFKMLFNVDNSKKQSKSVENEISLLDIDDSQLSGSANSSDSIDSKIKSIEDILHDLNSIKSNKSKLVDTLKKEIHNDDISDILILNSKVKSTNEIKTVIFPEELKKFEPYGKELDKLIEQEKTFINELKSQWANLSEDSKVKEIQSSKQFQNNLIKHQTDKIIQFYSQNWKKYNLGLSAGVDFYNKLLNYARLLKQNIVTAVDTSSQSTLHENFSNMNLGPQQLGLQAPPRASQSYRPSYIDQPGPSQYSTGNFSCNYPSSTRNLPSQYSQPSLHRSSTGGSFASNHSNESPGSYSRPPPALPPKRPSYSSQPAPNAPSQAPYTQFQPPASNPTGNFSSPSNPSNVSQQPDSSSNDLIYNQPSTYQPNMYNFFSSN